MGICKEGFASIESVLQAVIQSGGNQIGADAISREESELRAYIALLRQRETETRRTRETLESILQEMDAH